MPDDYVDLTLDGDYLLKDEQSIGTHKFRGEDDGIDGNASKYLGLDAQIPLLRQSTIETWLSCPRKFMFQHRYGLRLKNSMRSRALDIGTMYHAFMEDYYKGSPESGTVFRLGRWIDEIVDEIHQKELEGKWFGRAGYLVREDLESQLATARAMHREFIQVFPADGDRFETIEVEKTVRLRQEGVTGILSGTIDHLVRDRETKELWLVDHKTTSMSPMQRVQTLQYEIQPLLYRILVKGLLKETPVGIIHNVIRVPSIKMCGADRNFTIVEGPRGGVTKQYEGLPRFENYLARVHEWYTATGEYEDCAQEYKEDPPILQSWVRFEGRILPSELATILYEAGRAAHSATKLSKYYRCSKSCFDFKKPCPYLDLCRSHPSMWKSKVEERYEVEKVRDE